MIVSCQYLQYTHLHCSMTSYCPVSSTWPSNFQTHYLSQHFDLCRYCSMPVNSLYISIFPSLSVWTERPVFHKCPPRSFPVTLSSFFLTDKHDLHWQHKLCMCIIALSWLCCNQGNWVYPVLFITVADVCIELLSQRSAALNLNLTFTEWGHAPCLSTPPSSAVTELCNAGFCHKWNVGNFWYQYCDIMHGWCPR